MIVLGIIGGGKAITAVSYLLCLGLALMVLGLVNLYMTRPWLLRRWIRFISKPFRSLWKTVKGWVVVDLPIILQRIAGSTGG